MKANFLLITLTVLLAFVSCSENEEEKANTSQVELGQRHSGMTNEGICKLKRDGEVISISDAQDGIDKYFKTKLEEKDSIMGYHIDLEFIKSLLQQIDGYNDDPTLNSDKKIKGLRFYNALTKRYVEGSDSLEFRDLIIVPTFSHERDQVDVFDHWKLENVSDVNLYGRFRPCPKVCR